MGRLERAERKVWAKESSVMVSERDLGVLRDWYQLSTLSGVLCTTLRSTPYREKLRFCTPSPVWP